MKDPLNGTKLVQLEPKLRPKYDEMKPREGEAHSPYATKQSSSMRMILFIVIAWILILVAMLLDG